jgi:hypothetical protein
MNDEGLIDREELLKRYPALRGRRKNTKWRLDWLIRTRKVPIVKIGKHIFFNPKDIETWIEKQTIQSVNGGTNEPTKNKAYSR